jgi:hypothetical protein
VPAPAVKPAQALATHKIKHEEIEEEPEPTVFSKAQVKLAKKQARKDYDADIDGGLNHELDMGTKESKEKQAKATKEGNALLKQREQAIAKVEKEMEDDAKEKDM